METKCSELTLSASGYDTEAREAWGRQKPSKFLLKVCHFLFVFCSCELGNNVYNAINPPTTPRLEKLPVSRSYNTFSFLLAVYIASKFIHAVLSSPSHAHQTTRFQTPQAAPSEQMQSKPREIHRSAPPVHLSHLQTYKKSKI